jgi:SAM-dependent methyltransferase
VNRSADQILERLLEYSYINPPLPTFRRWWQLYRDFPGNSEIRVLEYEAIGKKKLSGSILDVGGGRMSRTGGHLPKDIEVDSVNNDPAIEPTHLTKPGEPFPIADNSYDSAVCLNKLEHVYNAMGILCETLRVLKPGGTLCITVPFMFRIHAHPDDFFRGTPSWWKQALEDAEFAKTELLPLVWGRIVAAGMIGGHRGILPKKASMHLAHLKEIIYAKLMFSGKRSYEGKRGDRVCAVSAGWFISAVKGGESAV